MLRVAFSCLLIASASAFQVTPRHSPAGLLTSSISCASGRLPIYSRSIGRHAKVSIPLRAQAEGGPETADAVRSSQMAEAWIRSDKAEELKKMLGGSSIYVVGLPGSGSEKVGSMLAKRFKTYRFLDMAEVMAAAAKKPECSSYAALISEIGETEFRVLEEAVLDQIQAVVRCVVSAESGVVLSAGNWGRMQQGLVVFLDSDDDTLSNKSGQSKEQIATLREKYGGYFDLADVRIMTDSADAIDDSAIKVVDGLMQLIKANPPKRAQWKDEHDKRMAEQDEQESEQQSAQNRKSDGPGLGFAPKKNKGV